MTRAVGVKCSAVVAVGGIGYEYQNTVGVMGGRCLISVNAAVRAATGLKGGDAIDVTLNVAQAPRAVEVPEDFQQALDASTQARTFFATLSNSMQRFHIDNIKRCEDRRESKATD